MENQFTLPPARIPTIRRCVRFVFSRWTVYALMVLVTLIALFYAEENYRGKRAWDRYRQDAEARGVKLDLTAFIPAPVPDDQNAAATPFIHSWFLLRTNFNDTSALAKVGEAAYAIMARKDPSSGQRRLMNFSKGLTKLNGASPESGTSRENHARAVLQEWQQVEPLLEELRVASRKPRVRYPVEYKLDEPFTILLPHLARIKQCVQILNARAGARLAVNETEAAFQDVLLMFWLTDSVRDEPFLINHLVRNACLQITTQPIWEGIVQEKWSDAQLQQLTARLSQFDFVSDMQLPMDAERAGAIATLEHIRRQKNFALVFQLREEPNQMVENKFVNLAGRLIPRGWYYFETANYCKLMNAQTTNVFDKHKRLIHAPQVQENDRRMQEEASRGGWSAFIHHRMIANALLPAMMNVSKRFAVAQVTANEAALACALERFRRANGKLPEKLEALTPQFIAKIPHDVLTGETLKYERVSDRDFVLSSVGWPASESGDKRRFPPSDETKEKRGEWIWRSDAP